MAAYHQLLDNILTALSSKLPDLSTSYQSLGHKLTTLSDRLPRSLKESTACSSPSIFSYIFLSCYELLLNLSKL